MSDIDSKPTQVELRGMEKLSISSEIGSPEPLEKPKDAAAIVRFHYSAQDLSKEEEDLLPSSFEMSTTTPLQVIFQDLHFSVQVEKKSESKKRCFAPKEMYEKQILHGLTGIFKPGRLTGIMGASGSGKTSLLNLVAGQQGPTPRVKTSGQVIVNGQSMELKDKRLKKICGYVQQDDVILETMTVREAISMAALLRLPRSMSQEAKLHRVDQLVELLHLNKCVDSIIKGISGGERKRVAVAMVMITNPSILYLDEPTSGLDSYTAYSICETLRSVARTGRTVAATIHQPNSDIFHLFDDLLLLSEGRIIYHGPAENMVSYFANYGYICPQYTNPADYLFMSILNESKKRVPESEKQHVQAEHNKKLLELSENWLNSEDKKVIDDLVETPAKGGFNTSDIVENATLLTQFHLLSLRALRNAWRNKLMLKGRLGQVIFLGVIIGLIFLQVEDDQRGVQDRQGSLFFISVNGVMSSCMGVLSIFAVEKRVFLREYESGMYGLGAYFFSRTSVELPFKIIFPIIGGTIIYWTIGYQAVAAKYLIMLVIMVALENCGTALGIFVASFFSDIAVALAIVPMLLLPLMVFSGFFVNAGTSPVWLRWIKYISPMKYAFVALIRNEFSDLKLHCTPDQLQNINVTATNGTTTEVPFCARETGEQVISALGFYEEQTIAENIIILVCMYVLFLILAYGALWRQIRSSRK